MSLHGGDKIRLRRDVAFNDEGGQGRGAEKAQDGAGDPFRPVECDGRQSWTGGSRLNFE